MSGESLPKPLSWLNSAYRRENLLSWLENRWRLLLRTSPLGRKSNHLLRRCLAPIGLILTVPHAVGEMKQRLPVVRPAGAAKLSRGGAEGRQDKGFRSSIEPRASESAIPQARKGKGPSVLVSSRKQRRGGYAANLSGPRNLDSRCIAQSFFKIFQLGYQMLRIARPRISSQNAMEVAGNNFPIGRHEPLHFRRSERFKRTLPHSGANRYIAAVTLTWCGCALKMSTLVSRHFLRPRSIAPISNQPPGFW